jgi:hypothetical protein
MNWKCAARLVVCRADLALPSMPTEAPVRSEARRWQCAFGDAIIRDIMLGDVPRYADWTIDVVQHAWSPSVSLGTNRQFGN